MTTEEETMIDEVYLDEIKLLSEKYMAAISSGEWDTKTHPNTTASERFMQGVAKARKVRAELKELMR